MLHAISISFACIVATESDTNTAITVHKSTMLARNTRLVFIRPTKKSVYKIIIGNQVCIDVMYDPLKVPPTVKTNTYFIYTYYYILYIDVECTTFHQIHASALSSRSIEYIKVHMQRKKYESGILQLNHGSLSFLRTSHIMNEERIQNKNQKIR